MLRYMKSTLQITFSGFDLEHPTLLYTFNHRLIQTTLLIARLGTILYLLTYANLIITCKTTLGIQLAINTDKFRNKCYTT